MNISKGKIIVYAIVLAVVWSWVMTNFISDITALPFYVQFALVSCVGYLFPSLIIGHAFEQEISRKITGSWLFIAASDLILPPLIVTIDGRVVPAVLGTASPDYFFFKLWSAVGVPAEFLFIFVYPVSFVLLVVVGAWLLTKRQLWQLARNGW